jgi:hypothetical protein
VQYGQSIPPDVLCPVLAVDLSEIYETDINYIEMKYHEKEVCSEELSDDRSEEHCEIGRSDQGDYDELWAKFQSEFVYD